MIAFKRIPNEYTDQRLAEAGFTVVFYEDIKFDYNGSPRHAHVPIAEDRLWYFRAVGNKYGPVNKLLAWGKAHDHVIMDDYLVSHGAGARPKFMHYEGAKDMVRMPVTAKYPSMNLAFAGIDTYPVILKFDQHGRQGMGTFLLRGPGDMDKVREVLEKRKEEDAGYTGLGTDWLLQEYIPNDGDYRAVVVGDTCLGIYKRRPKKQRLVQSASNGKPRRFKNNRFPRDMGDMAVMAAQTLGITVCGLDMVRHAPTGEPVLIEANEAPAFQVFENRVKVDVAMAIANELRRRHDQVRGG